MIDKSIEMMRKSFEKTVYTYTQLPPKWTRQRYGVYLHVPFCKTLCAFCPFYKVLFDQDLKDRYVAAIRKEIEETDITGTPEWIYFGGGTPNVLSLEELESIVGALRGKITIANMGIEILPALADADYIEGLKKLGFSKVSFGLESLSPRVNEKSRRALPGMRSVEELIRLTESLGLWSNVDMMIGLKGQSAASFLEDIQVLISLGPDQITTYPYMSLRGMKDVSSMPDDEKFETIEEAYEIMQNAGYTRKSIWCFAKGDNIYDSSRDELTGDYVGFGPAGFSTFDKYKVVNPEVGRYVENYEAGSAPRYGYLAEKSVASEEWRKFAKMIYSLRCGVSRNFPWYINAYVRLLIVNGLRKRRTLSGKGLFFAHRITKAVVESLPFPIQNRSCVEAETGADGSRPQTTAGPGPAHTGKGKRVV